MSDYISKSNIIDSDGKAHTAFYKDSEARNSITEINTHLSNLDIKSREFFRTAKTILIGDSYAGEESSIGSSWSTIFQQITGKSCIVSAKGGAGFTVSGYPTFQNLLSNVANGNADTKIIIVMGGFNEHAHGNVDNIQSSISSFMTYCKNTFPYATVFIGMCSATLSDYSMYNTLIGYKDGAALNGAVYIDGIENVLKGSRYFNSDNIHPNKDGNTAIAGFLSSKIFGGSSDDWFTESDISPSSGITLDNGSKIQFRKMGDTISITDFITRIGLNNTVSTNPTGGFIQIGSFSTKFLYGADTFSPVVTKRQCILQTSDGKFLDGEYNMWLNAGTVNIRPVYWSAEQVNWYNGTITAILPKAYQSENFGAFCFK